MKKTLIATLCLASIFLAGCTNSSEAQRALEGSGYTDVKIKGYAFFGCGQGDSFHTGFEAKGPTGRSVQGVVCSGVFKGATIRLD